MKKENFPMKKVVSFILMLAMMLSLTSFAVAEMPADGVYEGKGSGFGGELKVSVTVAEGKIADIQVISHGETAGISDKALTETPAAIKAAQSTDVEVSTGATFTQNAIKDAVKDALGLNEKEEVLCTISDPDVLVIGAGVAGMRAAIEACNYGAKVVILEKTNTYGGTIGGGTLIGINSKLQAEYGIVDDYDLLAQDVERLNAGYRGRNPGIEYTWNTELLDYFAHTCGSEVD